MSILLSIVAFIVYVVAASYLVIICKVSSKALIAAIIMSVASIFLGRDSKKTRLEQNIVINLKLQDSTNVVVDTVINNK